MPPEGAVHDGTSTPRHAAGLSSHEQLPFDSSTHAVWWQSQIGIEPAG
jgi:hypothetical protein